MATNEIFQYSVIPALMSGLSAGTSSISISSLLEHGSFGIGTFENMDGEMIVVDSRAYQMLADGSVRAASSTAKVPFAMVTRFAATQTKTLRLECKGDVEGLMGELLPDARNVFALVRIEGLFRRVKVRAIHAQAYPGQLLSELSEQQSVHEYEHVRGTVVGVRSPKWSSGVSVVGLHVHFIDDKRSIGGHVLELCSDGEVTVGVAPCRELRVQLPEGDEFGSRDLDLDEDGVKKAEG